MGLYAIGLIFFDQRWRIFGVTGGALALVTVFATSMIYMQMRTIPRWNHWSPPVIFLLYALAGGALLTGRIALSLWLLPLLAAVQVIAWLDQNRRQRVSDSTIGTATGLGSGGTVRQLMPPHSGENYLTREMVFRVGRKRARPLRIVAVILASLVPFLTILVAPILLPLAVLSHIAGALASRWLFFAEAKHVVGLYYGKS
jgi:DMSO reductase anchor subunit